MSMILDRYVTGHVLDGARETAPGGGPTWANEPMRLGGTESGTLRIPTTRFGTLDVEEGLVFTLREGLIGFEHCKRYVVVRHDDNSTFRWLQSIDEPSLAFLVVQPIEVRPDYAPTISDGDARELGVTKETSTLLFVIVTVPRTSPRDMTVNMLGPVVINSVTRQGKQVIVQDDHYGTRHRIIDELARAGQLVANAIGMESEPGNSQASTV